MPEFGRYLLPHWQLDPDATLLNHGSFGAAPKAVLEAQAQLRIEMERQPDQFFRRRIMPGPDSAVRQVAAQLAAFIGAREDQVALIENATAGINAVLASLAFKPGDEILFIDHVYNAVRVSIEDTCRKTGAVPKRVHIPIPFDSQDALSRIVEAAGSRTRLAIIDHITSPTALLLPAGDVIRALKVKGVMVLIDGAHSLGQIPLDLGNLGADWYTSNAHKWFYAPKGSAFLFASAEAAKMTLPISVSHFHGLGFPHAFDYTGTRDNTAWLALPAAMAFGAQFGWDNIQAYGRGLAHKSADLLARVGAQPISKTDATVSLRSFILPQRRAPETDDVRSLMTDLWTKHRIQVNASTFSGHFLIRLSHQIYNESSDIDRLAGVLERESWPGR